MICICCSVLLEVSIRVSALSLDHPPPTCFGPGTIVLLAVGTQEAGEEGLSNTYKFRR